MPTNHTGESVAGRVLVPSFAHLIQADKLSSVPTITVAYENMSLDVKAPPERYEQIVLMQAG